jgi:sulfate transport system permease protein
MAGFVTSIARAAPPVRRATAESPTVRYTLITLTWIFFSLFLFLPLVVVFQEAFRKGAQAYVAAFQDGATAHAVRLTLLTAIIVVPLNTIFGVAAAWAITRFQFRGKGLLTSLIELPLWVSPVIGGLIYVLVFGLQGWLGPWLQDAYLQIPALDADWNWQWREIWRATDPIKIIFAVPGIVLATIFVTFPFVARSLIPLMEAQGKLEEEAALTLGANGWQVFFRVTLPKIKWGLLYGVILCNARAMGEFGAVSVVSGHIRNQTNTIPLHIEILYNEYQFAASFAVASLLCLLGLVTLLIKTVAEWRLEQQLRHSQQPIES